MRNKHREMIEKANDFKLKNRDLENKLSYLTEELAILKKERENLQENYSQQLIVMNKKLEDSKQQDQVMSLDHRIKQNISHNQKELSRIEQHNKIIMDEIKATIETINSNKFFSNIQNDKSDTNKILTMKEAGVQESERKIKETFDKQVDEQTKEKEGITKVFDSVIKNKNEKFDKLVEKYNQAIKVRDEDIDKSKTEIIKIQ